MITEYLIPVCHGRWLPEVGEKVLFRAPLRFNPKQQSVVVDVLQRSGLGRMKVRLPDGSIRPANLRELQKMPVNQAVTVTAETEAE